MKAEFKMRAPPKRPDGIARKPELYVEISYGREVVMRRATEADKQRFKAEYAAFVKANS